VKPLSAARASGAADSYSYANVKRYVKNNAVLNSLLPEQVCYEEDDRTNERPQNQDRPPSSAYLSEVSNCRIAVAGHKVRLTYGAQFTTGSWLNKPIC